VAGLGAGHANDFKAIDEVEIGEYPVDSLAQVLEAAVAQPTQNRPSFRDASLFLEVDGGPPLRVGSVEGNKSSIWDSTSRIRAHRSRTAGRSSGL
jgi:hypothetical protein